MYYATKHQKCDTIFRWKEAKKKKLKRVSKNAWVERKTEMYYVVRDLMLAEAIYKNDIPKFSWENEAVACVTDVSVLWRYWIKILH